MRVIATFWMVGMLFSEFLLCQSVPPRTPVSQEEVWQKVISDLAMKGASHDPLPQREDLEIPVIPMAIVPRSLHIASACWEEKRDRVMLRVECEHRACNPFIAYVHARKEMFDAAGISVSDCRARPKGFAIAEPVLAAVRPGQHATVVFLGSRLRVSTEVTCLERGSEGEVIRVRNQEGAVFRARVSGPGTLQALMP
jgi:hypothetical protein